MHPPDPILKINKGLLYSLKISDKYLLIVFIISSLKYLRVFYNLKYVQTYRFVSFDISTSEICRDIDPKADGMMMGMVITKDSRFTAAFTK